MSQAHNIVNIAFTGLGDPGAYLVYQSQRLDASSGRAMTDPAPQETQLASSGRGGDGRRTDRRRRRGDSNDEASGEESLSDDWHRVSRNGSATYLTTRRKPMVPVTT
jgi:hypothetical protein